MGSGDWFKNIIRLKKEKNGKTKSLKGSSAPQNSNGINKDPHSQKESTTLAKGNSNGNPVALPMLDEDIAAIRIPGTIKKIDKFGQQLRLYKPLPPSLEKISNKDSGNQYSRDKVVAKELDLNAESETNPVANKPKRFRPKRGAVLICLFEGEKEEADLRVILTKRSSTLSTHSGEVALPGGKTEEGDADDIHTALREAKEEIGLDPSLVDVVTVLDHFITKYGVTVVPVIGILYDKKAFNPVPNAAEVEAIFDAPLEMFLKDENRRAEEFEWMGDKYLLHFFDFEAENKKYVIWALTAGILITAASVVYQCPSAFAVLRPIFWSGNHQCRY